MYQTSSVYVWLTQNNVINVIYSFRLVSFSELQWIDSVCEWKWVDHTFLHHSIRDAEQFAWNMISKNKMHAQNPFIFRNESISGLWKHFELFMISIPWFYLIKLIGKKIIEFNSTSKVINKGKTLNILREWATFIR